MVTRAVHDIVERPKAVAAKRSTQSDTKAGDLSSIRSRITELYGYSVECRTTLDGIVDLLYNEPTTSSDGVADVASDGLINNINGEIEAIKIVLLDLKQELANLHRRLS